MERAENILCFGKKKKKKTAPKQQMRKQYTFFLIQYSISSFFYWVILFLMKKVGVKIKPKFYLFKLKIIIVVSQGYKIEVTHM